MLAVALAAAAACDHVSAKQALPIDPPEIVLPAGQPALVDPATGTPLAGNSLTLDFGATRIGAQATRSVEIRNSGSAAFTIDRIESASHSGAFDFSDWPFTIAVGASAWFAVTFRPTGEDAVTDSVTLASSDGAGRELVIALRGSGFSSRSSPVIEVVPATLAFGATAVYATQTRVVTIENVGTDVPGTDDDNLLLASLENGGWSERRAEITGPDAAEFVLDWPPAGYVSDGLSESEYATLRVMFAPLRAGRKSATLVVYSNDASHPVTEVPITGLAAGLPPCDFVVSPPALSFGSVEADRSVTLSFTVENLNADPDAECLITGLHMKATGVSAGVFSLVNGAVESLKIRGGGSAVFPVRFQPTEGGSFRGEVVFGTSSPVAPEVRVSLSGGGEDNCLVTYPQSFDFGPVHLHCRSRQRTFTLYNVCIGARTVTAFEIVSATGEFNLAKLPSLPLTLAGGRSAEFGVTYAPGDVGADSATVSITLQGGRARRLVEVTGTGSRGPRQTDVFAKRDLPKVDFLIVVDNSATMASHQTNVTANLAQLADYIVGSNFDYHVGVTTTDVSASGEAGRLLPLSGTNPWVVTRSTPNAVQVLRQNLNVGTAGSETESLLRPAYLALTSPLSSGPNVGFYRDEAQLLVVIVSDAADQDPLNTPESFYENFLRGLKGPSRPNDVSVAAIVPRAASAPSGCAYDTATAGLDTRVSSVVRGMGGLIDDICSQSWADTLTARGTQVWPGLVEYLLSTMPDMDAPDPIIIAVDGQPYPQFDAQGVQRWEYLESSNSIDFFPRPQPGSTVSVSYYQSLGCLAAPLP